MMQASMQATVQGNRASLPGGREHWQHGPIELVIAAHGEPQAVACAYALAWQRFQAVLGELVGELPGLRSAADSGQYLIGPVAQRMLRATSPYAAQFITPMAAVAGSVADEVLAYFSAQPGIRKAYVNNGGDIALHLREGESFAIGLVADAYAPTLDAQARIEAGSGVRGVATSGWRGRSFSLGIADSVTVLARSAAQADAAATMIANAVNVNHPAIERAAANSVKDDTDLGARLVTVSVGALPPELRAQALNNGRAQAQEYMERGLIIGAALALQNEWRTIGSLHTAPLVADHPISHASASADQCLAA